MTDLKSLLRDTLEILLPFHNAAEFIEWAGDYPPSTEEIRTSGYSLFADHEAISAATEGRKTLRLADLNRIHSLYPRLASALADLEQVTRDSTIQKAGITMTQHNRRDIAATESGDDGFLLSDFSDLHAAIFDAAENQNEKRLDALLSNNLNVILAALKRAGTGRQPAAEPSEAQIERVARIVFPVLHPNLPWDEAIEWIQNQSRNVARSAISSLRSSRAKRIGRLHDDQSP